LYRYYEPNLQRWVNRDPIKERGGINLYQFVRNDPILNYDGYGLKDRAGWFEGGLENDCSSPLWVIDLDNKQVYQVPPGEEAPEGVDWDFVLLPGGGGWHKIGMGELDVCDSGPKACQWGFGWDALDGVGGHRPAKRNETDAIDKIWEEVPEIYIAPK
jgi:hypothetical protein